jgi:predicted dehydrogenase
VKHRTALVGLGLALPPHAASLKDLSDRVDLAYAVSRDPQRRAAFSQEWPDIALVDGIAPVLADPSVRSVILLTPPTTHLDLVRRCARAGKHVLLEKPVEVTLERARDVVSCMETAGGTLGIVLQHRFRPAALALADTIAAGDLGRLLSANVQIRWWRDSAYFAQPGRGMKARDGGGVLLTQAIHTLDLFLNLVGPVEEIFAHARTSGLRPTIDTEDMVAGVARLANGAVATIDANTVSYPGFPERIELAFESGSALLVGSKLRVEHKDGRRRETGEEAGTGAGTNVMAFPHDAHRALLTDFVDAVEAGRAPRCSGQSALAVHELIDAMLRSSDTAVPIRLGAGSRELHAT